MIEVKRNFMMINKQLVDPKSIVVVGGSNDINKAGW